MNNSTHWENIYASKKAKEVSWYQELPLQSIEIINASKIDRKATIIDVGGGTSNLIAELLRNGFINITALDISNNAIKKSQFQLGSKSKHINWINSNILTANLPSKFFSFWHDRAVFHFLTDKNDRELYKLKIFEALRPKGFIAILAFAENGPKKCSGLPVQRFSISTLKDEFANNFYLVCGNQHSHFTPAGNEQKFISCLFRMK
tara:strand:- start:810 stop:1424 length:615 start_codon:yes stop_codon:yes gene_type:complete